MPSECSDFRSSVSKDSESRFESVRGLRYHLRVWGRDEAPPVLLLHGWMDCSASWQFVVDAMGADWKFVAPDWRGFGLSEWAPGGVYGYQDYMADLDAIAGLLVKDSRLRVVGHSMGGNVASLYASVRPERVAAVVNVEGFGLRAREASDAPLNLRQWLDELSNPGDVRIYPDYADLAARIRKSNPCMSEERSEFVARQWGCDAQSGGVVLRADPGHNRVWPQIYRLDEACAHWARISVPYLWVEADESRNAVRHGIDADELNLRRDAVPGASTALIRGAGHMAHLEQPGQLAELIERFFLENAPGGC